MCLTQRLAKAVSPIPPIITALSGALYSEDTEIPITTIGRLWGARGVLRAAEEDVAPFDPHASDDELRRQTGADAKRREAIAREARELVERFYGLALLEAGGSRSTC